MIQIENLSIGYLYKKHHRVVASDINAKIYPGELTCLLGANGVGKSTLLRTLSAFQSKLAGNILIEGKEIDAYTDKQLARVISVVLTEKCDLRNMLVSELIGLGRSPYTGFWGTLSKEDEAIVEQAAHLVGIDHLLRRMVHTLSDGERQKVMIAKALAQETPIIFLDEPTAFLDFPSKIEMMQLLLRLSRENGVTVGTPEDLALDGSLCRFFHRKGVQFNPARGIYEVAYDYTEQLRLTGEGQRRAMVEKALRRNGIECVAEGEALRRISVTPDQILLDEPGKATQHFSTIDQLIQTLTKQNNQNK